MLVITNTIYIKLIHDFVVIAEFKQWSILGWAFVSDCTSSVPDAYFLWYISVQSIKF